jgi:hypothetical protein
MGALIATIGIGLCAFAGLGLGISFLASSSATASTGPAAVAPVNAHGSVETLPQLAPGPANPGGTYTYVITP